MAEEEGGFTFPKLPAPLPLENAALLARATVTAAPAAGGAAPPPPRPLAPPPPRAPPRARRAPFEPGFSPMDWVRLARAPGADLASRGGALPRRDLTPADVAAHATAGDGWTALRGRVYNLTPYLKFHPGGAPILRSALGKDCTKLFDRYHAWVNAEALLAPCLVGYLAKREAGAKLEPELAAAEVEEGLAAGETLGRAAAPREAGAP
jgi:cytochrome b involved in lipid metabolism